MVVVVVVSMKHPRSPFPRQNERRNTAMITSRDSTPMNFATTQAVGMGRSVVRASWSCQSPESPLSGVRGTLDALI